MPQKASGIAGWKRGGKRRDRMGELADWPSFRISPRAEAWRRGLLRDGQPFAAGHLPVAQTAQAKDAALCQPVQVIVY